MFDLNLTKGQWLVFFSLFVAGYWLVVKNIDVYEYALIGVIYELLWIIMLGAFILIPLFSIIFWIKEKAGLWSPYFYTVLICACTFLYIYFY